MTAPDEPTTPSVPSPPPTDPPTWAVTGAGDRAPRGTPAGAPFGPPTGTPLGPPAGPLAPPTGEPVPDLDDRPRPLDRRVVTVWRVSTAITLLIPTAVVTAVLSVVLGTPGLIVGVVLLVLVAVCVGWYPSARYDRWRWRLTDLAVELDRGVIVRQAEALPYFRIQQIDVNQGPIDRMLGLASLQVTSASASGSVTLPGIAADQAPGVRRALLTRASAAVAGHDSGVRDAV